MGDVLVVEMSDDDGMPDRIGPVLIHPRLQRGDVHILHLLAYRLVGLVLESGGIGMTSEESVARFERVDNPQVGQKGF